MKNINMKEEEEHRRDGRDVDVDQNHIDQTSESGNRAGEMCCENSCKHNSNPTEIFYDCMEPDWTSDECLQSCDNICIPPDDKIKSDKMHDNHSNLSHLELNTDHHTEPMSESLDSDSVNSETNNYLNHSTERENEDQNHINKSRRQYRSMSTLEHDLDENNNQSVPPTSSTGKSNVNKSSNNRINSPRSRVLTRVNVNSAGFRSSGTDENENKPSDQHLQPSDQDLRQSVYRQKGVTRLLSERMRLRRRVDIMLTGSLLHLCVLGVLLVLAMMCRCVFEMLFPCFGGENCMTPPVVKKASYW